MPPQEAVSAFWELAKLVITAVLGVLTFIAGQIFMKLAEPAVAVRGQIGVIKGDLLMYANKSQVYFYSGGPAQDLPRTRGLSCMSSLL